MDDLVGVTCFSSKQLPHRQNVTMRSRINLESYKVPTWYFQRHKIQIHTLVRNNFDNLENRQLTPFHGLRNFIGAGRNGLFLRKMVLLAALDTLLSPRRTGLTFTFVLSTTESARITKLICRRWRFLRRITF